MKVYELFGKDGFHTSIATTFGVDFDAYENILLARFRGAGCHNNLLVVDGGMLSFALEGASSVPAYAGKNYTVTGAKARAVFHPKIVLQLGRKSGRMIVSSANVTASGLAGNLEVAAIIECTGDDNAETKLIISCLQYLERFLDNEDQGIRHQLNWMRSRTPWLRDAEPAEGVVQLTDGSAAGFLTTGRAQGIGEQFLQCIGGALISRLIAISPYWDEDLAALSFLAARTFAPEVCALMDCGRHDFPSKALQDTQIKVHDFKRSNRFIHAKTFIVQTKDADHVLFGSANCTTAALGNGGSAGLNEEACLYRAMPPGAAIEALGLQEYLAAAPLTPESIPSLKTGDEVPLADLRQRNPGRFECASNVLKWWPPSGTESDFGELELLDSERELLPIKAERQPARGDDLVRFGLSSAAGLTFARIRYADTSVSAPAIILFIDVLRAEVRDARNKKIDDAIGKLDGELEASLLLLDVINEIQDAEAAQLSGTTRAPRRTQIGSRPDDAAEEGRMLSYEDFVAGRRLRSDVESNRSSLGNSNVSSVRSFLNRLLSLSEPGNSVTDQDISGAFSMGDEVADAGAAVEGGESFDEPAPTKKDQDKIDPDKERRLRREHRHDNREALLDAVYFLQEEIPEKAKTQGLDSVDLLRLRAVLMILASAGWEGDQPPDNLHQVLPPAGDRDGSWPRLMGKALSSYFGKNPAIKTLKLEDYHDHLPEDVVEFWATCMWAVHVATLACERHKESSILFTSIRQIKNCIYQMVGLLPGELMDARITRVFDGLNAKLSARLKFEGAEIVNRHRQTAGSLAPAV